MSAENQNVDLPLIAPRRAKQYRIAAASFLLAGLAGAGAVYWLGSGAVGDTNDPSMLGFNRAEQRQMALLYGKQGQLFEDLINALKQPGTQAILIIAAAAVLAGGCFYFARIWEDEAQQAAVNKPHHD